MTTTNYNTHSKSYNHVFDELQDYMLTNEFIYRFSNKLDMIVKDKNTKHEANKPKIKENYKNNYNKLEKNSKTNNIDSNNNIFSPGEKDKLFWCFYSLQSGMENYELNKSASFKTEKDFKFKTAEKIKDYKDILKPLKLRVNEIQDELINQPCITIKGLVSLCYIYNINVIYIKNKTYYEILTNSTSIVNIIVENKVNDINKTYTYLNVTDEMIKSYKNNYWKIDNFNSPIKAISGYTLNELQDICKRLSISIEKDNKKLTKKELYENILRVL
jgi:hypothetical protein